MDWSRETIIEKVKKHLAERLALEGTLRQGTDHVIYMEDLDGTIITIGRVRIKPDILAIRLDIHSNGNGDKLTYVVSPDELGLSYFEENCKKWLDSLPKDGEKCAKKEKASRLSGEKNDS